MRSSLAHPYKPFPLIRVALIAALTPLLSGRAKARTWCILLSGFFVTDNARFRLLAKNRRSLTSGQNV